jgi:hypothetical protein
MKFIISILGLAFSANAFAAIKISATVEKDGNVSSPTMVVEDGEWASIIEDDLILRVMATSKGDLVTLNAEVFEESAGTIKLLSKSTLSVGWDNPAMASWGSNGIEKLKVRLIPSLITETSPQ